jgi:cysteinyl-tRNA synthetase
MGSPEDEKQLAVVSVKLSQLHGDVGDIKDALKELTAAITRLALVEQQQRQTSMTMERAFEAIDAITVRLKAVEDKLPVLSYTSSWVEKLALVGATAFVTFLLAKLGLKT